MNISLFPKQAAGQCALIIRLIVLVIVGSSLFSSCSPESDMIQGSFDGSRQSEGGPSRLVEGNELGWNVALELTWGMSGALHGKSSRDEDRDWLPFGYEPVATNGGSFSVDGSLEFIKKGSSFANTATHLSYLNLLGDVTYHYSLGESGSLFGGLGPYIGYGIGGSTSGAGVSEPAFGGDDGYKRFDAGLHLKAGYAHPSSLQFSFSYELGLYNQSPAPDYTSHNRTYAFNVGYSLSKIIGTFKRK
jgi:hypothetical protein